jgi:hypothetical protein
VLWLDRGQAKMLGACYPATREVLFSACKILKVFVKSSSRTSVKNKGFLPGFEASVSVGVGVPRNTSVEIIERLNKEVNIALADSSMKARIADLGGTVLGGSAFLVAAFVERLGELGWMTQGVTDRAEHTEHDGGEEEQNLNP